MLKNSHIIGWIGKETNGNDTEGNCRFYINARRSEERRVGKEC